MTVAPGFLVQQRRSSVATGSQQGNNRHLTLRVPRSFDFNDIDMPKSGRILKPNYKIK